MTTLIAARTYNQNHVPRALHARQAAHQHLLDLELSVGSATGILRTWTTASPR